MSVAPHQRFHSTDNPCPACGGGQDRPTGSGDRCYGFVHEDGRSFFCTNVEGTLPFNDDADAWPHLFDEDLAERRNGKTARSVPNGSTESLSLKEYQAATNGGGQLKVVPRTQSAPLEYHYNIQIHLPSTKDVSVYNAIFRSLREHLL